MTNLPGNPPLAGRVAIVTGAGGGIGRAEARALARLGARVVVNDLPRGETYKAEVVAAEIRAAGGQAVAISGSVTRAEDVRAIVEGAMDAWGRVDILVNNAGFGRIAPIWSMSDAEFDAVIAVNLRGSFNMIRAVAPVMMRERAGVIVNTSSESGTGDWYFASYASAKEGVVGLTRAAARDLGRHGVRCNAVRPRAFDTGQATAAGYERTREYLHRFGVPMTGTHPMGPRQGTSAEVGEFVAWLCTDAAAAANGRVFLAGCGEVAIYDEPRPARSLFNRDGWTVETLAETGTHLLGGVRNEFADLAEEQYAMIDARAQAHLDRFRPGRGK
ncbi:MAG: SDR family NAD(P)-dependent oxidoreductase [Gammaproteobacteria bacterium]